MIVALVSVALVIVWMRHRSHKKDTRAGLTNERPVFSLEPPHRRLGDRRRERL